MLTRYRSGLSALVVAAAAGAANAQWDPAAEFSATANPNGVWSYGYTNFFLSPFLLAAFPSSADTIDFWSPSFNGNPDISHNATAATVNSITARGDTHWEPGDLVLRPGVNNQYTYVRWTAPIAGSFDVNGSFVSADNLNATCEVFIVAGGAVIYANNVIGPTGTSVNFALPGVVVPMGDTIDFIVGMGAALPNHDYFHDAVALRSPPGGGMISPVPAPTAAALLGLAVAVAARRRR